MRAGRLDEWIKIRQPAETIDALGDEREPWPVLLETWAAMVEVSATEVMRNPQIRGELDAVFVIRDPCVSINSRMRIEDSGGRLFEIQGISALPQRGTGYEIMAKGIDRIQATI